MTPFAWQKQFAAFLEEQMAAAAVDDAAHDRAHIERVVNSAVQLAETEQADLNIVMPAAWLHDCVVVAKDSPQRAHASQFAAETAVSFLQSIDYPQQYLDGIAHAIAAHSFSAGIVTRTIEAKVVQDADRLDAIGAIGIARCFMVGNAMGTAIYHDSDPFCAARPPDDRRYSVDHFYAKLFTLVETMKTEAGREEAKRRTAFMQDFLAQLGTEIGVAKEKGTKRKRTEPRYKRKRRKEGHQPTRGKREERRKRGGRRGEKERKKKTQEQRGDKKKTTKS